MDKKEHMVQVLAAMYEQSLNNANNIVGRAQNPLTAMSIVVAVLVYMGQVMGSLQFNDSFSCGIFFGVLFVLLGITVICIVDSFRYIIQSFKQGGYKYKTIGSPQAIKSIIETSDDVKLQLIEKYLAASEHNFQENNKRAEYIRLAMEKIIWAVVLCFLSGIWICLFPLFKH
jgi:hypothetical protein